MNWVATFVLGTGVRVHFSSILLIRTLNSEAVSQSDKLVLSMSQGKVPLSVSPPTPIQEASSSAPVLNNKATLTSTLQTVY